MTRETQRVASAPIGSTLTSGTLASTTARNASNVVANPSRDPSSRLRCVLLQLSAAPQRRLDRLQPLAARASVPQSSSPFRPSSKLLGTQRHRRRSLTPISYLLCRRRPCLSLASRSRAVEEGERAGEICPCTPAQRRILRAYPPHPPQVQKSLSVDKESVFSPLSRNVHYTYADSAAHWHVPRLPLPPPPSTFLSSNHSSNEYCGSSYRCVPEFPRHGEMTSGLRAPNLSIVRGHGRHGALHPPSVSLPVSFQGVASG